MFWRFKSRKHFLKCVLIATLILYGMDLYLMYYDFSNHAVIYDVYTSTCQIPYLNPFENAFSEYTQTQQIPCNQTERLIISNETHLIINPIFIEYFKMNAIKCSYKAFWRKIPKGMERDNKIIYGQKEYFFNDSIRVNDEFVKIICRDNIGGILKDYHAFVPVYKMDNKKREENSYNDKLNVIIIGVDSVPRHHFYRQMPKTLDYLLNDLDAIEYLGYHKVGDNTFANLIPIFTGQNIEELKISCWHRKIDKFDNCDFIWQEYIKKGYATAFIEEESWMGLFNYLKGGFIHQPTTHYWSPFSMTAETDIGTIGHDTKYCWGSRPAILNLLEYTIKFVRSYLAAKQNFFATFWESSITHDLLNFHPEFDSTYMEFLKTLNETGILNNSFLFFMSDHGYRFGKILQTYQGRIEAKLPMFYIIVPSWFKKKNPYLMMNLEGNAKKLTSHFDLYATLKDIVNKEFASKFNYNFTKGISLFQEIPEDRTCEQAGISEHFCTCHIRSKIQVISRISSEIVGFAITQINNLFVNYQNCSKLYLNKIIEARIFDRKDKKKKVVGINFYTVVFQTKPGDGIFECTVKCKICDTDFEVVGTITRTNLYDQQSYCIDDAELKLYCFCEKQKTDITFK